MGAQTTGWTQMMDDNPGVTKMMDDKPKEAYFKCPSCGEMMTVESKGTSDNEHSSMSNSGNGTQKKQNAANMPMDKLKNKVVGSSTPGMFQPPPAAPNLNTY